MGTKNPDIENLISTLRGNDGPLTDEELQLAAPFLVHDHGVALKEAEDRLRALSDDLDALRDKPIKKTALMQRIFIQVQSAGLQLLITKKKSDDLEARKCLYIMFINSIKNNKALIKAIAEPDDTPEVTLHRVFRILLEVYMQECKTQEHSEQVVRGAGIGVAILTTMYIKPFCRSSTKFLEFLESGAQGKLKMLKIKPTYFQGLDSLNELVVWQQQLDHMYTKAMTSKARRKASAFREYDKHFESLKPRLDEIIEGYKSIGQEPKVYAIAEKLIGGGSTMGIDALVTRINDYLIPPHRR